MKNVNNKIKLKKYPYTYARVAAMRSKLINKQQYHKLMKMELNSLIKFLEEETTYKEQIDKLAINYSGVDLIEHSLNENLVKTTEKLRRISPLELEPIINSYVLIYDIENIKTILRAKKGKFSREYAESLLIPAGILSKEHLLELLKKESLSDIAKSVKFKGHNFEAELKIKTDNLAEIENQIDRWYLQELNKVAILLPKEGELISRFVKDQITIANIKTMLRLKKEDADKSLFAKFMFPAGNIPRSNLIKMATQHSINEMIEQLKRTTYGSAFAEGNIGNIIDYELALDKLHVNRNQLRVHQNPLTVLSIISFMFAKYIEVKNLKTLVKAKQLGIRQEIIESKLLV